MEKSSKNLNHNLNKRTMTIKFTLNTLQTEHGKPKDFAILIFDNVTDANKKPNSAQSGRVMSFVRGKVARYYLVGGGFK